MFVVILKFLRNEYLGFCLGLFKAGLSPVDRQFRQGGVDFDGRPPGLASVAAQWPKLALVALPVAEFSQWRERGVGALMLISFVAASLGGLVVGYGKKIWVAIAGS